MAARLVSEIHPVKRNEEYDPHRKGIPRLREMSLEKRDELIRENPDYGVMICRCEEISKGEIIDALISPLPVYTVDGVKTCTSGNGAVSGRILSAPACVTDYQ